MVFTEHKAKLEKLQSLIALFLMIVFFSVLYDDFRTPDNFWTVMRQVSINACLSVGMTMVILTGGIDLSVGSVLAFSGAIAAGLLKNGVEISALAFFLLILKDLKQSRLRSRSFNGANLISNNPNGMKLIATKNKSQNNLISVT